MKIQTIDEIYSDFDFDTYGLESIDNLETFKLIVEIQRNQILQSQLDVGMESVAILSEQLKILKQNIS